MDKIKTQVGIIGAGPAGLTLAHWLLQHGISSIILERRDRAYVEGRVRAGLLEQNTVDIFTQLGLAERLHLEGQMHHGVYLSFDGERLRIPFGELTGGRNITIYGQQEVVKDLTDAWLTAGQTLLFEAPALALNGLQTTTPSIVFEQHRERCLLACDFIAACDGFHGIGRQFFPKSEYQIYEHTYPFSWLGILVEVAPSTDELIYAYHQNGFALHSLRSPEISRLYLQVDNQDQLLHWPNDRIWEELATRLGTPGWKLNTGPILEKSITPMRSYMVDNMQYGRLFLAGDAAHIVPPTGGKGLNLAVADVKHLVDGLVSFYKKGSEAELKDYSKTALKRIWRAQDFSDFMTQLMHKQAPHGSRVYRLQRAKFDYLKTSPAYRTTLAENYVGLPFELFE